LIIRLLLIDYYIYASIDIKGSMGAIPIFYNPLLLLKVSLRGVKGALGQVPWDVLAYIYPAPK